ncbi:MAG TPA: carbamate kinase [bacterium]|nr:carbamate kinase [bacterium]
MKIVIALGGNAFLQPTETGSAQEQLTNIRQACPQLATIIANHQIVITHGNGPQVGNILAQNEIAAQTTPAMPLDVCGAMSQGLIGYFLQQQLHNELQRHQIQKKVVTLITQTVVNKTDPAFRHPSKPVGSFHSEKEARDYMKTKQETWIEDSGRGWRKLVPSPKPVDIVEKNIIKHLFSDDSILLIVSGGGGIPVVKSNDGNYYGIEAVIDKDLASEKLAQIVNADILMILTDVPYVYLNYKKPEEQQLGQISLNQLEAYASQGHFARGSMGPKIKAAINFLRADKTKRKRVVITSLLKAVAGLHGGTGTQIIH